MESFLRIVYTQVNFLEVIYGIVVNNEGESPNHGVLLILDWMQ